MQEAPAVLRGRTAAVAGASSRLALPVATALATLGATTVVLVPDAASTRTGQRLSAWPCDLTDPAAVSAALHVLRPLDLFAGIVTSAPGGEHGATAVHQEAVDAAMRLALLAAHHCRRPGGTVLTVAASPALHDPVDRLTRSLAASWRGRGLRVNGLVGAPGEAGLLRALALLAVDGATESGRTIALGDEGLRAPVAGA